MVETELKRLLTQIQNRQCEEQTIEVKSAHGGCPEKLYDTLSSFRWQSPFFLLLPLTMEISGGLAEYPGRWFGCNLLLKPVQKEQTPA